MSTWVSCAAGNQDLKVRIKTSLGEIEGRLFHDKAPRTVSNFVELARKGFLQKPFTLRDIAAKVREAIDGQRP